MEEFQRAANGRTGQQMESLVISYGFLPRRKGKMNSKEEIPRTSGMRMYEEKAINVS